MSAHDWGFGEADVEAATREEMNANREWDEWQRELDADRVRRHDPARLLCVVCGEKPGLSVYGLRCAGCFEAQREERDAA